MQTTALLLCAAGLAILIYPLTGNGIPLGILFALAVGVCWAGGTVYLKWAHIDADQMGVGSWQMTVAAVILVAAMLIFEGRPEFGGAHLDGYLATAWTGIAGNGIAYALWFTVVRRLPAVTASLGVLAVPVIGIVASFLDPRRGADRCRHGRICPDLCRVGLRVAHAADVAKTASHAA